MRRLIYILPIVVVAAFGAVFWVMLESGEDPSHIPSPLIDRPAPAFRLPALMAPGTVSEADLKGRVTVFNVFASWCIPCRAEHPMLMRIARDGKARVVGLNYKDKPEDAKAWLDGLGNPYAKIASDRSGRVAIDWGVTGVPETFIIDAAGRIRYKHIGPIMDFDYTGKLKPMIERLAR